MSLYMLKVRLSREFLIVDHILISMVCFITGAMAYLFHGVHEQSYVAHVISYALRIGRFRDSTIAESLAELMPL